jgi:hypothetical protein
LQPGEAPASTTRTEGGSLGSPIHLGEKDDDWPVGSQNVSTDMEEARSLKSLNQVFQIKYVT